MINVKKTKKLIFRALSLLFCVSVLFFSVSCGSEENEGEMTPEAATITLADINRGEGAVNVSGDEQFSLTTDGTLVASPLSATINGKDYEILRLSLTDQVGSENLSVSLSFYIPDALNRTSPPDGTYTATTEGAALDETYVEIFVIGADDSYNTFSLSTGTVTVLNTDSEEFPYKFDIEFDVQNLKSFDDLTVDVQGVIK